MDNKPVTSTWSEPTFRDIKAKAIRISRTSHTFVIGNYKYDAVDLNRSNKWLVDPPSITTTPLFLVMFNSYAS